MANVICNHCSGEASVLIKGIGKSQTPPFLEELYCPLCGEKALGCAFS